MAEETRQPALRIDPQQFAQEVAQEIAADLRVVRAQKSQKPLTTQSVQGTQQEQ